MQQVEHDPNLEEIQITRNVTLLRELKWLQAERSKHEDEIDYINNKIDAIQRELYP